MSNTNPFELANGGKVTIMSQCYSGNLSNLQTIVLTTTRNFASLRQNFVLL